MKQERPIKVLIAKAGLDGHERGALVVAMGLRDAGMEVVYTGIRNTPEQIVTSAIQEDVDAIGLSSLSGGHMAQFKRVMELLKKAKVKDVPVFAGGIIPDEDVKKLQKLGIKTVFGPGSSIASIVEFLNKNIKNPVNHQELTKLVSRLESGKAVADLKRLFAKTGRAHIVGITGPPGVGKSSLIDLLIERLRSQKKTIGVIAIDPTSPISGGALLGDRLRMQRHSQDEGVFIRSLATRHHHGGLTDSTPQIVHALDAAGFDVVIVETVGAGQDEVEVAEVADTVVVVLMPELGDQIQRAKSGLMEIADILVINKSDLQAGVEASVPGRKVNAAETAATTTNWRRPILHTSAKTGEGIAALVDVIDAHHNSLLRSGELAKRRARAARAEVIRLLQAQGTVAIMRALEQPPAKAVLLNVAARRIDPYDAIKRLSAEIFGQSKRSGSHGSTRSRRKTRLRS